jgi:ADP-heptose:LPS heptosyltransferase
MEDKMKDGGGGFRLLHGRVYVNKTRAPEIFYDSNRDPVVLRPGEARFEKIMAEADVSGFFLNPELWNAQKTLEAIAPNKELVRILMDASKVERWGDHLQLTVIPKAYMEVFGPKVKIHVLVPEKFVPVWQENPDIDGILVEPPRNIEFDLSLDVNDLELKWREKVMDRVRGYRNRTELFLENLGLALVNKIPVLVLTDEEKEAARKALEKPAPVRRPLIGIARFGSCPAKTYPKMLEVSALLQKDYDIVYLDEKLPDGGYATTFREMAAVISNCDIVVANDSAVLHVAGALRKRIVAVFGYVDGKIYAEDYEKAIVVQAPCPYGKSPCWWDIPCLKGKSYQEKEQAGTAHCLDCLEPQTVVDAVQKHLKPKKILACMLTFNLLNMTKKALASIRSFNDVDILVVDNESSDGTPEWLLANGYTFVSKKMGVANACNIGVRKFLADKSYDAFLLLNNDIILQRGTIDGLLAAMLRSGDYWGITAAEAENVSPWCIDSAKPSKKGVEVIEDIPASAYSCTIFSRKCFETIGVFDERFFPRYIEDNDLTLRIRLAGGKFVKDWGTIFYHVLGGVIKTNEMERLSHDFNWCKNIKIYEDIWGIKPHDHQDPALLRRTQESALVSVAKIKPNFHVVLRRGMGGIGDHVFMSIVPKVLKKTYPQCKITVATRSQFFDVYRYNKDVDAVIGTMPPADVVLEFTDLEYGKEMEEMNRYGQIVSSRAEIFLRAAGLDVSDIHPVFKTGGVAGSWGPRSGKKRIAVSKYASNMIMTWPHTERFVNLALDSGRYEVKVLDERKMGGEFEKDFWTAVADLEGADVFVGPNTSWSNIAGAMDIPALTIFSYRNGEVMARMFPSMRVIQGQCSIYPKKTYCDYAAPCFGGGEYRRKENIKSPVCISGVTPEFVLSKVDAFMGGLYGTRL